MPVGLEVIGALGQTQITDAFMNPRFVSKGTIGVPVGPNRSVNLVTPGVENPILALGATAAGVGVVILRRYFSAPNWVFVLAAAKAGAAQGAIQSVPYFVFDAVAAPPPSASSGFGLQIFDAAGKLKFDSAMRFLRFFSTVTPPSIGGYATLPAGKTYAVAPTYQASYFRRVDTMLSFRLMYACELSAGGVTVREASISRASAPLSSMATIPPIMVFDVTNY